MANLNEWVYRRFVCWCGVNEPRCPRPGRSRWWRPAPTRVCRSPGPGGAGRGRGSGGQPGAWFQHNDVFMKLLLQPVQRRRAGRLPWRPGAVLAGAFSSPGLGWAGWAGLGWAGRRTSRVRLLAAGAGVVWCGCGLGSSSSKQSSAPPWSCCCWPPATPPPASAPPPPRPQPRPVSSEAQARPQARPGRGRRVSSCHGAQQLTAHRRQPRHRHRHRGGPGGGAGAGPRPRHQLQPGAAVARVARATTAAVAVWRCGDSSSARCAGWRQVAAEGRAVSPSLHVTSYTQHCPATAGRTVTQLP